MTVVTEWLCTAQTALRYLPGYLYSSAIMDNKHSLKHKVKGTSLIQVSCPVKLLLFLLLLQLLTTIDWDFHIQTPPVVNMHRLMDPSEVENSRHTQFRIEKSHNQTTCKVNNPMVPYIYNWCEEGVIISIMVPLILQLQITKKMWLLITKQMKRFQPLNGALKCLVSY